MDSHHLLAVHRATHLVQHASLFQAEHASVDGVPITKSLGEASPFSATLGDVKHRIDNLNDCHAYIAT